MIAWVLMSVQLDEMSPKRRCLQAGVSCDLAYGQQVPACTGRVGCSSATTVLRQAVPYHVRACRAGGSFSSVATRLSNYAIRYSS